MNARSEGSHAPALSERSPDIQPVPKTPEDPESDFGILILPVDGRGTWAAFKGLRGALRDLGLDASTRVLFVKALDDEGRAVGVQDPRGAALVVGYALRPSQSSDNQAHG